MTTTARRALSVLACLLVIGAGVAVLAWWTLGFSAFTSYSHALKTAGPVPREAPALAFVDQFGRTRTLASLRGRYALLHAFYGSCGTTCPIVIGQIRTAYVGLPEAQRRKLAILSITVDPARDTTANLRDLWIDQGRTADWIMAQPANGDVDRFARGFGIWVFARKDGTINHSAYLFLIDPEGRIVRVIAPGTNVDALGRALQNIG